MTEKKNRVEVFFDDEELAVLEELSTGVKWSVEKIVYDTVARAHFSEEAKKRHAAFCRFLSREPIDLESDWAELKRDMERDMAWRTLKSMGQDVDRNREVQ